MAQLPERVRLDSKRPNPVLEKLALRSASSPRQGAWGQELARAAVAIVDGLMGDEAIMALGGPNAAGIFVADPVESFIRADSNGGGQIDISDAIGMLNYQFGTGTTECLDAMDVNDDGSVDISDPVSLLGYLFNNGTAPTSPFPSCGEDPTPDNLDCIDQPGCP